MRADVFISYSHADDKKARAIADFLERQGVTCWVDDSSLRLSEKYDAKIAKALRTARVVLWLASESSLQSDYVRHEISTALALGKPIGPVFLEPLESKALKPPFDLSESRVHGIEYFKEPIEEKLATLLDDLRPLIGRTRKWKTVLPALVLVAGVTLGLKYLKGPSHLNPPLTRPAIAVFPFEDLGAGESDEYLGQGIAHDLVTRLTGFRALPVVVLQVSASFPQTNEGIQRLADELGVRYLVTGSVRRSGKRLVIDAQLADAKSGRELWTRRFDEQLRDVLQLQDAVATAIVGQLAPEMLQRERQRAIRMPPRALAAWDALLQGDWHVRKQSSEDIATARALYARAVDLDPDLAAAYSGIAMTYVYDIINGWSTNPPEWLDLAHRAAIDAVQRDDDLASAHVALGTTLLLSGKHEEAARSFRRAAELFPSYAIAHSLLGIALALGGEGSEAIASVQAAIKLSPNDPWIYSFLSSSGLIHFSLGQYEDASYDATRSLERNPRYPVSHYVLSASLVSLGRNDEACVAWSQTRDVDLQGRVRKMISNVFEAAAPEVRYRWTEAIASLDRAVRTHMCDNDAPAQPLAPAE